MDKMPLMKITRRKFVELAGVTGAALGWGRITAAAASGSGARQRLILILNGNRLPPGVVIRKFGACPVSLDINTLILAPYQGGAMGYCSAVPINQGQH